MRLIPSIASYSGKSYNNLRATLNEECLQIIAKVATVPTSVSEFSATLLKELAGMHVLTIEENTLRLSTAVFLEDDQSRVISLSSKIAKELAENLNRIGGELNSASPEIKNFLAGKVAIEQALSKLLREGNISEDWKSYTGTYAQSKVDFDEDTELFKALGQDLQLKSMLKGEKYTAVFIGSGGKNYQSLIAQTTAAPELFAYRNDILTYLTDSYAMLVGGMLQSDALQRTAEEVNLYEGGQPKDILVSREVFQQYLPILRNIMNVTYQIYADNLPEIFNCLRQTTAGRQGVEPEKMMMHFWRYCRKALGRELYLSGFLNDHVPETGSITVFYDNTINEINQLFT